MDISWPQNETFERNITEGGGATRRQFSRSPE